MIHNLVYVSEQKVDYQFKIMNKSYNGKSNQHNLTMSLRQDKKKIVAPFQVC